MLPEEWQGIRRLLLLCFLEEADVFASLLQTVNQIQATLKQTQIYLLALSDHRYTFNQIESEVELKSFNLSSLPLKNYLNLIDHIQPYSFETAVVLTNPDQSPFSLAYLCYLANIPIRVGQSQEFGGGVLSHCIRPPLELVSIAAYHLHLLKSLGFPESESLNFAIA